MGGSDLNVTRPPAVPPLARERRAERRRPSGLRRHPLRTTARAALLVACAGLGGCDAADRTGAPAAIEAARAADGASSQPKAAARPREPAPEGWRLTHERPGRSGFRVAFPGGSADAFGTIASDRSLERLIDRTAFSRPAIDRARARYAAVESNFPDFPGWMKLVNAGPLGHRKDDGEGVYDLSYLSERPEIHCHGNSIGTLRCLWGRPDLRYQLVFDYRDIRAALPYILGLAARTSRADPGRS